MDLTDSLGYTPPASAHSNLISLVTNSLVGFQSLFNPCFAIVAKASRLQHPPHLG